MLGLGLRLFSSCLQQVRDVIYGNIETEAGQNLSQENNFLLILEQDS